jgi:hypothetical protein
MQVLKKYTTPIASLELTNRRIQTDATFHVDDIVKLLLYTSTTRIPWLILCIEQPLMPDSKKSLLCSKRNCR